MHVLQNIILTVVVTEFSFAVAGGEAACKSIIVVFNGGVRACRY